MVILDVDDNLNEKTSTSAAFAIQPETDPLGKFIEVALLKELPWSLLQPVFVVEPLKSNLRL